jgi:glycogen debranching enzyme
MLAGSYLDYSADLALLKEIWPNVLAALDWIDNYGDIDHDGFVEYQRKADKGLIQQGWKDSYDSVFHHDGSLATAPIALCEVQGYVYEAKKAAKRIARKFGLPELARKLDREAEALREKFEREFWDEELGTYVLALDGAKKACRVRSSNAGHCLWTGIASQEHADRLARTLMGEDLFCGWGIRTISSNEIRYNPMSYHNGSVWPHDTAIIASGLARYGHKQEALRVLSALFEASSFMELNRLPELFCGFHKRSDVEGPTLYPVACSPQAWAAGSVYMLFESCLGLRVQPDEHVVEFSSPQLPENLDWVELKNLCVGDLTVDLRLQRDRDQLSAEILKTDGDIKVQKNYFPAARTRE